MKPLAQYLAESERTYDYRIKMCGDVSSEFIRQLKSKLDQFAPNSMSDIKTTPIQKIPTDFPNFKNEKVSMFDVSFRYPAIEPQIKQLAQLMQFDPNKIVMSTRNYNEELANEYEKIEDQNQDLLANTDYPADDQQQKALKKDYGVEAHDHVVLKNQYRTDFTVAGGKTPPAKTTNDLPMGSQSPMSRINRPARPATGAKPRG
jgi:hypothetical protein